MQIVRVAGKMVIEIMVVPPGMKISDQYPAEIVKDCVETTGDVRPGWVTQDGGRTFAAPVSAAPPPPAFVSSAQAKIQLRRAGLRDQVDAAVQASGGEVLDWFTDARIWERDNPYVASIGTSLKLKDADVDALFVAAAKIAA